MTKLLNTVFIINCIAIVIISTLIGINFKKRNENEREINNYIEQVQSKEEFNIQYKGYNVIGIITIPKIEIKYPILEISNEETLKISITKFWGDGVNKIGNLTLAGHNNYDETMFGKINKLQIGDLIQLTDTKNITKDYKIHNKYITNPKDVSILKSNDSIELTLITCTNGNKQRLIIKAIHIE